MILSHYNLGIYLQLMHNYYKLFIISNLPNMNIYKLYKIEIT